MKRRVSVLFSIVLLSAFSFCAVANAQQVILREGTPVILRLAEEVSSENKVAGSLVNFTVALDVEVDGYVVIAKDSLASGTVTWAESKCRVGTSGKVQLSVDATKAVDSRRVALRSNVARAGENSETSSVAMGAICCPLFLLMKGDDAVYPIGTEVKAYVAQDMTFPVSSLNRR
jgi:hypothetical protein